MDTVSALERKPTKFSGAQSRTINLLAGVYLPPFSSLKMTLLNGITNQARTFFETLGVSTGFPVLTTKTDACVHSIDSVNSRLIGGF